MLSPIYFFVYVANDSLNRRTINNAEILSGAILLLESGK